MNRTIKRLIDLIPVSQTQDNRGALQGGLTLIPPDLANPMLDYVLERTYLEELSELTNFVKEPKDETQCHIEWIRIDRLPVPPGDNEQYDLISRWQAVLTSLHAWKKRILFLLMRNNGITNICIGIMSRRGHDECHRFYTSLTNNLPGMKISVLSSKDSGEIRDAFMDYRSSGVVTGIPSFRKNTKFSLLQTLDRLAFGIRNQELEGEFSDANFSLLVVADPMDDEQITDVISKYKNLGSELHIQVKQTMNEGENTSRSMSASFGIGALLAMIVGTGNAAAAGGLFSLTASQQIGFNRSIGKEYLNKFAEYSEKLTDIHCKRLCDGRSLGFWNTGVYVMATKRDDVITVLGMLRSIYSGDETYIEPIRIHDLGNNTDALNIIRRGGLIPILNPDYPNAQELAGKEWHILGKSFQYASTPLNTEELSLVTSLPRKDVPGLRLVRNAVRFASNSAPLKRSDRTLTVGRIKDTGVEQSNEYIMSIDALVRHALVTGGTGCGKTTTCRKIVSKVLDSNIPVLIIEPAKDEWARWAVANNIKLFMPGVEQLGNIRIAPLKINPFQPGGVQHAEVDMLTHCEQLISIINASLPTSDVLPVLIDEAIFQYLSKEIGPSFLKPTMKQLNEYPKLEGILSCAKEILHARGYEDRVERGLLAALETRFSYLTRGKRGTVLNVIRSTPWEELFFKTAVVNLSRFSNPSDRALIMSLLMLALREYRQSMFENDIDYRSSQEKDNPLAHLTVVEEAHTVLAKNETRMTDGNPQSVVADIFGNMLSEIRSYGEGMMLVDQVPTRLIPDAIKNTNYKISHRLVSPDDCSVMASALGLRQEQMCMLPMLETGDIVVMCDRDDAASWVKVIPK